LVEVRGSLVGGVGLVEVRGSLVRGIRTALRSQLLSSCNVGESPRDHKATTRW
jgi:hypothetical protein